MILPNVEQVRRDFPMLSEDSAGGPILYFDNAATNLKPSIVVERLARFYSKEVANVHRGIHHLSAQATTNFEAVREQVGAFIGATSPEEIIFTKGTTESINLVASVLTGVTIQKGDEILLTEMEHHSNIVPWQMAAQKVGAHVIFAPINDSGELVEEEFFALLNPKVKVVAFTHCSNMLGTINNLKPLIAAAKSNGSVVLVDGAQGVAKEPVSVQDLDCDFYAFSSHKLCGPFGVGILFGKRAVLAKLPPYQGGGGMIEKVTQAGFTTLPAPIGFEAGTPNVAGVIGFGAALEYISGLGWDFIQRQEAALSQYIEERFSQFPGLETYGKAKKRAPIFSFNLKGVHAQDTGTLLDQQGIAVRVGHHCTQLVMQHYQISSVVRASFCFYNTKVEVDQFITALAKAKELLT